MLRETFESSISDKYGFPGGPGPKKGEPPTELYESAMRSNANDLRRLDDKLAAMRGSSAKFGDLAKHIIPETGPWVCAVDGRDHLWHGALRLYWLHVNVFDEADVAKFTELVGKRADLVEYLDAGLGMVSSSSVSFIAWLTALVRLSSHLAITQVLRRRVAPISLEKSSPGTRRNSTRLRTP